MEAAGAVGEVVRWRASGCGMIVVAEGAAAGETWDGAAGCGRTFLRAAAQVRRGTKRQCFSVVVVVVVVRVVRVRWDVVCVVRLVSGGDDDVVPRSNSSAVSRGRVEGVKDAEGRSPQYTIDRTLLSRSRCRSPRLRIGFRSSDAHNYGTCMAAGRHQSSRQLWAQTNTFRDRDSNYFSSPVPERDRIFFRIWVR